MRKVLVKTVLLLAIWAFAGSFMVPYSAAAGHSGPSADQAYSAQVEKIINQARELEKKKQYDKALRTLYQAKRLAHKHNDKVLEKTITDLQKQLAAARKKYSGNVSPNSPDNAGGGKYSKTGSGALIQDDPTKHFQGCSGPKSKTFAFVADANGKFLGYDKSTIDAAVKRGDITRDEANAMTISPVSKRVGADGKEFYTDNTTGERVNP